jgi:hypothetical protein
MIEVDGEWKGNKCLEERTKEMRPLLAGCLERARQQLKHGDEGTSNQWSFQHADAQHLFFSVSGGMYGSRS